MPREIENNILLNMDLANLPDNKEDFQLIWLDALLGESPDILATQEMLRSLNTNAQFYTDVKKCLELIQNIKTEHILLVVSGQFAHAVLPRIVTLRSVRAVSIFCETRALHKPLLVEYSSKVIDIFTDRDALIKSISETMKLIEKQDAIFHLFDRTQKSTRDLSKESASFLWHQLLTDVLRKMPADEPAKNEMLDHCAAYYRHNKDELKKIERFRTSYTPSDAVRYYTENSFLYKLLNRALRTEDIELLYIFRFFIIDLCGQLEDGKKQLVETEPLIVHRGQQMPKEEFENLKTKIGSLISTNGFLSTSRDEEVSHNFSNSPLLTEDMLQVSITINADPKLKTVIFADVTRQSEFVSEKEVLFSLGAVFRIDRCEFDETLNMGKLILTATDEGSDTLKEFLDAQKDQLQVYSPMIYFGRLLMNEMNEIDRAATYFQRLLATLPEHHPDITDVYNQIGVVHYMRSNKYKRESDEQKALEMFEKALEIRRNIFGHNDIRIATSMNNIGSVYNDRKQYDRAFDYYQSALQIIEIVNLGASVFKGNLLRNCGILKERRGDQQAALSFYIQADEIYSQCLPNHHPTRVQNLSSIAESYSSMKDFSNALTYFKRVYASCEVMLLPHDEKFKDTWEYIVFCCWKLGDNELAVTYLNRVLEICERLSLNLEETSNYYVLFLAELFESTLNFDIAFNCYQQYLRLNPEKVNIPRFEKFSSDFFDRSSEERIRILTFKMDAYERLFPCNDVKHSSFLVEMGDQLEECNDINLAYQCYQKAFDILEELTMNDTEDLLQVYRELVGICLTKNDNQSALNYLERAFKWLKQQELSDKYSSSAGILLEMARLFECLLNFETAFDCYKEYLRFNNDKMNIPDFETVLDFFWKRSPEERICILTFKMTAYERLFPCNDVNHSSFLVKIGGLLERCNDTDFAFQCYQKALDILEVLTLDDTDYFFYFYQKLIDICITKNDNKLALNYLEKALRKYKQSFINDGLSYTEFLKYIAEKYEKIGDNTNALHYFEKALVSVEATMSYNYIQWLLFRIFKICVENDKEQELRTYIQRSVNIFEKQPVILSKCYSELGTLYQKRNMEDVAFQYYKQLLLTTEVKDSSFAEELDELWFEFVEYGDRSLKFSENVRRLTRVQELCERYLPPHHFKLAIVSWAIGYLHEEMGMDDVALKSYQKALAIWEELIYNRDDKRTKDALYNLFSFYEQRLGFWRSFEWIECPVKREFKTTITDDNGRSKWICILQRLKFLKMLHMDDQWEFHLTLQRFTLNTNLCSMIVQQMLKVCTDQINFPESNTSLDVHSVICCLEFISHWFLEKQQYLESLLHRQHQLELETKTFPPNHSHIGWSLWFIGLIFQKMNDHDLSLEYLTRALKIFEHLYSKWHRDICKLEEDISQTKQTINERHTTQITISENKLAHTTKTQQIKFNSNQSAPRSLQMAFHLD